MYSDSNEAIRSLDVEQLKLFASKEGYEFRESWGKFLDLYTKEIRGEQVEVLIPSSSHIRDYDARVFDLVRQWAEHYNRNISQIVRELVNSAYESVRFVVNEGEDENTVSFDTAVDLLQNGMKMIDASATIAMTGVKVGHIQGRRPDSVRRYLDRVRVGQTEVGSYVINILMPVTIEPSELGLPESEFAGIGTSVTKQFRGALSAASAVSSGRVRPDDQALVSRGLSSNFTDALVRMVGSADAIRIAVGRNTIGDSSRFKFSRRFDSASTENLRKVSELLRPVDVDNDSFLNGTIVSIRESVKKTSGSFVMEAMVGGELKVVRGQFQRSQRDEVFRALHDKTELELIVTGKLINKSGRLSFERINSIETRPRGTLT